MAMCSSDANAISAVFTRDIAPVISRKARQWDADAGLIAGRVATVLFLALSMIVATQNERFHGIISIVIAWVAALMGPISIPLMLGMLRQFRRCGPTAALVSWAGGLIAFAITKYGMDNATLTVQVATPLVTSLILYVVVGLIRPEPTEERDALIESINNDDDLDAASAPIAEPLARPTPA